MKLKWGTSVLAGFLVLIGWLIVWESLSRLQLINENIFPAPSLIFEKAWIVLTTTKFLVNDLLASLQRLIGALLLAVPAAVILGSLLALHQKSRLILYPLISVFFPLPKVAIYPFLLATLGIQSASKVALIFLAVFFICFVSVFQSVLKIVQSAATQNLSKLILNKFDFYYHIIFKGMIYDAMIGLRSGVNYGLTMVVVSETTLSNNGIGYFIWSAWDQYRIADMYVGLFILGLIGFLIGESIDRLIDRLRPYYVN